MKLISGRIELVCGCMLSARDGEERGRLCDEHTAPPVEAKRVITSLVQLEQQSAIREAIAVMRLEIVSEFGQTPNFDRLGEQQDNLNNAIANARQGFGLPRLRGE